MRSRGQLFPWPRCFGGSLAAKKIFDETGVVCGYVAKRLVLDASCSRAFTFDLRFPTRVIQTRDGEVLTGIWRTKAR